MAPPDPPVHSRAKTQKTSVPNPRNACPDMVKTHANAHDDIVKTRADARDGIDKTHADARDDIVITHAPTWSPRAF